MDWMLITAIALASLTPVITELVKKYAIKNKVVLALSPGIYGVMLWLLDALSSGVHPGSDEGLTMLATYVGAGAIGGQLIRDPIHEARKMLLNASEATTK